MKIIQLRLFFIWIKLTDFFKVKLIIFGVQKMTPKNGQFHLQNISNFDPIKKALIV